MAIKIGNYSSEVEDFGYQDIKIKREMIEKNSEVTEQKLWKDIVQGKLEMAKVKLPRYSHDFNDVITILYKRGKITSENTLFKLMNVKPSVLETILEVLCESELLECNPCFGYYLTDAGISVAKQLIQNT